MSQNRPQRPPFRLFLKQSSVRHIACSALNHYLCGAEQHQKQSYMADFRDNTADRIIRHALDVSGKVRILFVCLGNICRSPAAEGILRQKGDDLIGRGILEVDSAGLYHGHRGELPDKRMRVHAIRRGYELTHRARPVREADFDDFDIIFAMDDSNYDNLRRMAPAIEDERKVCHMIECCPSFRHLDAVPDPYYEGAEGFENVLNMLEDGCDQIIRIIEQLPSSGFRV